jgi:two-component system cell cycle response regulator DivK
LNKEGEYKKELLFPVPIPRDGKNGDDCVEIKKLLIVEDNELNLKLYLYALRPLDAQILIARNGEEALDLVLREKPDAVVLDIQIPGISGMDVAKAVRADPDVAGTPIIAVTAYSMAGDKEKILAAGCDYYLAKPIDTRAFPRIIQSILDGEVPQL